MIPGVDGPAFAGFVFFDDGGPVAVDEEEATVAPLDGAVPAQQSERVEQSQVGGAVA